MKKILSLLMLLSVAAFLTVGMAGCGGPSSTPTGVSEDDNAAAEELSEEEEAGEEAIGQE